MASFKRFEEILAWQKARAATRRVYELTTNNLFSKDFALRDQIRRSSISIMANIAEGHGRHSDKEFANFLNIAHGSVTETQSHLYVAIDLGYLDKDRFAEIYGLLEEVAKMTMGLIKHLRNTSP